MSIKNNIKKFWRTFLEVKDDLEKALDENNSNEIKRISANLNEVMIQTAGCYLSVHKEEEEFYECTFLPDVDKTSQLICVFLKKFTPAFVNEKWMIHDCIPPMSERVQHMKFDVRDLSYTIEDITAALAYVEEVKAFDLHVVCSGFEWMAEPEIKATVDRILKHVLGDVICENNLNEVTFAHQQDMKRTYVPMGELYETMADQMDEKGCPFYTDLTQTYRIFKLNASDVSNEFLQDRILISTLHPYLFVEVQNKERAILDQMTRLGGEYGVMAYEIKEYDEPCAQQKHVLEKEMNDLFVSQGTARIIGSAIGKKHVYFDVAVLDKEDFKKTLLILAKNQFLFTYRPY